MIRLRYLRLRAFTQSRAFGADIPFRTGLNVIQAPNTSGKSTCLQAIIYALGLERSLGPQLAIPLPYAMRERIHETKDLPYEIVLQSFVELEVENAAGEVMTLRRDAVGGKNPKLVQSWNSSGLSQNSRPAEQRDFFVHDAGSATSESGFHGHLARFIGWHLPVVNRFDGSDCLLYLEAIFPMLFVEQKRGWSAIQGPFPTFFRIQDVARRVMEFLLDLEAARNRRRRAELRGTISDLVGQWQEARKSLEGSAALVGRVRGLPLQPTAEFAAAPEVDLQLYFEGEWTLLTVVIELTFTRTKALEAEHSQSVEEAAPDVEERVTALRAQIDQLSAVLEAIRTEHASEAQDRAALESRVRSLQTDLRRNQDAQKLKRLGSELGTAASEHICPTCHQSVSNELLPSVASVGMGLDENIAFLKSQLELYEAALENARERIAEIGARYNGIQRELRDRQQEFRALRQELTRPSSSPSRATIEQIVRLQAFLERLRSVEELSLSLTDELASIASQWAVSMNALRSLPTDELTNADQRKLESLQASIRRHLDRYGFKSFQAKEISLSNDNFRPLMISIENDEKVEKEINFEMSASDAIRLKWAYYLSCLELMDAFQVNHPGLIIFDEPGQQEIETLSLSEFLRSAARSSDHGRQVIVTTSETFELVSGILGESSNIVSFPAFILQPLDSARQQ